MYTAWVDLENFLRGKLPTYMKWLQSESVKIVQLFA